MGNGFCIKCIFAKKRKSELEFLRFRGRQLDMRIFKKVEGEKANLVKFKLLKNYCHIVDKCVYYILNIVYFQ